MDGTRILWYGYSVDNNWQDIRDTHSVGTIFGPKIAGDSIDIRDYTVLTGSDKMCE